MISVYPGMTEVHLVGSAPNPRLSSPVHLECELYQTLEVGDGSEGSSTIVVGTIQVMHVRSDLYQEGQILAEPLRPVSRLGGLNYGKLGSIFQLKRPSLKG